ncbi:MAG: cytochrome c [Terracidiphilus sp.]|jgi:mono/diheme cytochrome c family protein
MMRRAGGILLIALAATFSFAAVSSTRWEHVPAGDHARTNPLAGQPEAAAAGALIYREHCLQCHKANGEGDGHKRPALRSERLRAVSDGDIEWFLREGDLGHGMPSWSSLPQAQRWQVVAYLRSIQ